MTPDERMAAFRTTTRAMRAHGRPDPRAMLQAILEESTDPADVYGAGGAIDGLEREVAGLLGKPAAVFVPSGTMAQQVALRIAADARGCRTVAYHPTCHVEVHEQRGYAHVHGLGARLVGPRHRPPLRADLDDVAEPLAALLLELPQREIGGVLPPWDDVLAQAAWARERGTALHLDGARVWECTPHYGLTLAEIAAPFDTVYVSFYKTLGGIAGAALAGDAATIAHARVWIRRLGGNLVAMYPMVLSARRGLRERLPRIPGYVARARRVAEQLVGVGVRVNPDPPHVNMLHAFFAADPDRLVDASAAIALDRGVTLVMTASPTDVPGTCRTEIVLGDAADAIPDGELGELLAELVARATG